MSSAFAPEAAARTVAAAEPSWLMRALRWLIPDRRDGYVALALLLGVWLSNVFGILALLDSLQLAAAAAFAIENLGSSLVYFVSAAVVARWSAGWTVTGWRHHLLLALAMAAALAASAVLQIALARWWPAWFGPSYEAMVGFSNANPAVPLSIAVFWFPLGLLLAAQFQRSARERSARSRLDALLREQRQAQRRFAEARLQQIQSRIDPELLFEMLEQVRRLYLADAARAELLLDELTDFLRAVLPRLTRAASTLEREFRIAGSYLRLRGLADGATADIDATLPAELAAVPFPPGLILPLVDALRGRGGGRIGMTAQRSDAGWRVSLSATDVPDGAALARLRATLDELYGSRYRLDVARLADQTTVALDLPDEDRRD